MREIPSNPPGQPVTPEEDDFPDIRWGEDGVYLHGAIQTVFIPNRWIKKNSGRVHLGGNSDLNALSLHIFAGRIVLDNTFEHEILTAVTATHLVKPGDMVKEVTLVEGEPVDEG